MTHVRDVVISGSGMFRKVAFGYKIDNRAGRLTEAEEFIKGMPFEPNAFGWCSYLAACRKGVK
ncbi:hypothetical protein Ancab_014383 [Ancistrocladus abbreviatus]